MDAGKFIKEYHRLCNNYRHTNINAACAGCPFWTNHIACSLDECKNEEINEVVSVVEQWSKEHPQKTYKDDFLEKFPKTNYAEEHLYKLNRWCELYNYGDCDKNDDAKCEDCWNEPIGDE